LGRINNRSATDVELLTVPLSETIIVPVTLTNNRPADMVKGIAGIASKIESEFLCLVPRPRSGSACRTARC
jgi:hypothetical protein